MACAGALTSIVMTAAGSFIANGGLSEIFGSTPFSSAAGATAGTVAEAGANTMMCTADTVLAITETTSQGWFSDLSNSLSSTLTDMKNSFIEFSSGMKDVWNNISTAPVAAGNEVFLQTVGTYGPATAQFLKTVTEQTFSTAINFGLTTVGQTLGGSGQLVSGIMNGDPRVLGSIIPGASSYVGLANSFINASQKGGPLDKTFQTLDKTITAGVDGVSNWVQGLGEDVKKLGSTVDWQDLQNAGSPGQLVANMEKEGTLGPMYEKMKTITISEKDAQQLGYNVVTSVYGLATGGKNSIGLTDLTRGVTLGSLGVDLNAVARQGASIPPGVQKQIYDQFASLTNQEVAQVKAILNNTQPAVKKGADLFDPTKLYAESYTTLTTPIRTASPGYRAIYEDASGSVNPELNNLGSNLKGIIPDDFAVANAALARSFGQIKGIQNAESRTLGEAISNLENLKDLPQIQDQSQYVTEGVKQFWQDYYGTDYGIKLGTGRLDTIVLSDVIGFAAGYNSGKPLTDNASLTASLASAGAFDAFTQSQGIYETIHEFTIGTFGPTAVPDPLDPLSTLYWEVVIPGGWAAAGTYTGATDIEAFESAWIDGIVPFTALANVDIYNNYPDAQTVYANDMIWQEQYGREYLNRQRCGLDVTDLPATDQTAINFASALPEYGRDTEFGGLAMWLERTVDVTSLGGQATIGAMREGRNTAKLSAIGLQTDAPLNTDTIAYPGDLTPNQYNKAEAEALVVRS